MIDVCYNVQIMPATIPAPHTLSSQQYVPQLLNVVGEPIKVWSFRAPTAVTPQPTETRWRTEKKDKKGRFRPVHPP